MAATAQESTGIRLIPPLVYAAPLLIGLVLERLVPLVEISMLLRAGFAVLLWGGSLTLVIPTVRRFRRAKTPFDVRKPATSLITDGPNRFTRNPGYVALTLLYVGLGFAFGSVCVLMLIVPTLVVMGYGVIRKDEQHLEAQFGEEYLRYKPLVRRWI